VAVTIDAVGPSSAGTAAASTTLSWSHTCSGTDRLLTVGLSVGRGQNTMVSGATYDGVSMTEAGLVFSNNQNDGYIQLFYLVNPPTGAHTVLATCDISRDLVAGSVSFTGVDQTTPVSNIVTSFGSSAPPNITVTSGSDNMAVAVVGNGSSITSSDKDDRWLNNFNNLSASGNAIQSTAAGASSVAFTYSANSDWWGAVGMNINAVSTPPAPIITAWFTA
jgi:hypothetical protein